MALSLCIAISGCGGRFSLDGLGADRSLVTGSISPSTPPPTESRASDEGAIRATIAAWMPGEMPPETVPWVNSNTGSTGAISRLADSVREGNLCRTFKVSRASFDGVNAYDGKACSERGGTWSVVSLDER